MYHLYIGVFLVCAFLVLLNVYLQQRHSSIIDKNNQNLKLNKQKSIIDENDSKNNQLKTSTVDVDVDNDNEFTNDKEYDDFVFDNVENNNYNNNNNNDDSNNNILTSLSALPGNCDRFKISVLHNHKTF
jgi:hypothetical protein